MAETIVVSGNEYKIVRSRVYRVKPGPEYRVHIVDMKGRIKTVIPWEPKRHLLLLRAEEKLKAKEVAREPTREVVVSPKRVCRSVLWSGHTTRVHGQSTFAQVAVWCHSERPDVDMNILKMALGEFMGLIEIPSELAGILDERRENREDNREIDAEEMVPAGAVMGELLCFAQFRKGTGSSYWYYARGPGPTALRKVDSLDVPDAAKE